MGKPGVEARQRTLMPIPPRREQVILLTGEEGALRAAPVGARAGLVASSPTRQRILSEVARHPGISVSALKETLGLNWGPLYHHLGKLRAARLLDARQVGRLRLLYPGSRTKAGLEHHALLRGQSARRLALAIRASPGMEAGALSAALGVSPRAVYHHLKRLHGAGLIESPTSGRYKALRSTPLLESCLAEYFALKERDARERAALACVAGPP